LSRDAITKKDFLNALKAADEVLTYDASNYHGRVCYFDPGRRYKLILAGDSNVFVGRAAFELGQIEKSEQVKAALPSSCSSLKHSPRHTAKPSISNPISFLHGGFVLYYSLGIASNFEFN
jgi:hypothetical protein